MSATPGGWRKKEKSCCAGRAPPPADFTNFRVAGLANEELADICVDRLNARQIYNRV